MEVWVVIYHRVCSNEDELAVMMSKERAVEYAKCAAQADGEKVYRVKDNGDKVVLEFDESWAEIRKVPVS